MLFSRPLSAVLAAATLLIVALPAQPVVAAATPVHQELRPRIMAEAAAELSRSPEPAPPPSPSPARRLGEPRPASASAPPGMRAYATNPRLQKEVFGFVNAGSINRVYSNGVYNDQVGYPSWQFDLLSTVAFFGLHVDEATGHFVPDSGWSQWNSSDLAAMVAAAHAHGTKVVLSIILQDTTSGMCWGLSHGAATISDTVAEIIQKGVDGVNVDYEGLNSTAPCNQLPSVRDSFTRFVISLRQALPAGAQLSVDTYGSSAGDPLGFYDIRQLAPYVDFFFVMAYDLDLSNCNGCLGPVSPLSGYPWNDTRVVAEYTAAVAPTKVVLGLPYYGRKACVANLTDPNQAGFSSWAADKYVDASVESVPPPPVENFSTHIDQTDRVTEWDTWYSTTLQCNRQLYWDNASSLGAKYDLVNQAGLRGAGIFTLDYGGNRQELWNQIAIHFQAPAVPADYYGVAPVRLLDTRNGTGGQLGPLGPGQAVAVALPGTTPPGITAAVLNVTVAQPTSSGYVTAWPHGTAMPLASNLNFTPGALISNMVTVPVGANRLIDLFNSAGSTHLVVDLTGYYLPGGGGGVRYNPVSPYRQLDTRAGPGRLGPGSRYDLRLTPGAIPNGADSVALNVTAVNPSAAGYLTVWDPEQPMPATSSVNFRAGEIRPNLVITKLSSQGVVSIYNYAGTGDVVVDVMGWFGATGSQYVPLGPRRFADTRSSGGPVSPGGRLDLGFGLGYNAAAVVLNVTVVNPTATGYVSVWPAGEPMPLVSNLNFTPGVIVPSMVMAKLGAGGAISAYNSAGSTQLVIDAMGYFV